MASGASSGRRFVEPELVGVLVGGGGVGSRQTLSWSQIRRPVCWWLSFLKSTSMSRPQTLTTIGRPGQALAMTVWASVGRPGCV